MAGANKLVTAGGGGVVLTPASSIASDKTMQIPSIDGTLIAADASGNVGIGVAPSAWSSAFGSVVQVKTGAGAGALAGSSTDNFRMFSNTYYDGSYKRVGAGYAAQYEQGSGTHVWSTAGTSTANSAITFSESMRIDTSGNLLVGTTTAFGKTASYSSSFQPATNLLNAAISAAGGYGGAISLFDTNNAGYGIWCEAAGANFVIRKGSTTGGASGGVYISNGAGSWSAASDERLKNILHPIENATEKLSTLRCVVGEYKDQVGSEHPFLIAQDVQAVFPEVVNTFGDEGHLGMSYTDMVPILVKAIQEQQALITQLQADVAALKGTA